MNLVEKIEESSGDQEKEKQRILEEANSMGYYTQEDIRGTLFSRYWSFFPKDIPSEKPQLPKSSGMIKGSNAGKHKDFYKEVRTIGVNVTDLAAQQDIKEKLILKYYSGWFGENGSQPISQYESAQIGRIFKKLVSYAERISLGDRKDK